MVSGYRSTSTEVDYNYPVAFKEELLRAVPDYTIDHLGSLYERLKVNGNIGPLCEAIERMTEERIKLIMYMLKEKPWDFCYLVFIGADRLQHPLWEEVTALDPPTIVYFHPLAPALTHILDL